MHLNSEFFTLTKILGSSEIEVKFYSVGMQIGIATMEIRIDVSKN